jgi:3-oxoacyl-[acyl-carrier protein] reductase
MTEQTPPVKRVALVTGASRGIGAGIAAALAQDGYCVIVNHRANAALAERVCGEIRAGGGEAYAMQADVCDAGEVDAMIAAIEQRFGTIDVLINNAGVLRDGLLALMSNAQWDAVIDTNLKGVFQVTRAAVKLMIAQRRGRVINVVSVSGLVGTPGQANYAASKGGVISMTRALAKEVARYNVQVNAVAPGFIETEMLSGMNEKHLKEMLKQVPMGRAGRAEEVGALVRFLASPANSYMTGQVLVIDGGLSV